MSLRWRVQHPIFQVLYALPELERVRLRSVEHSVLPIPAGPAVSENGLGGGLRSFTDSAQS